MIKFVLLVRGVNSCMCAGNKDLKKRKGDERNLEEKKER